MYIATIDGGTSNTRVYIWHDREIIGFADAAVGARNTAITGSQLKLSCSVRDTLQRAVRCAQLSLNDIDVILAAGMLTSNTGIADIPHILAPLSLDELAQRMVPISLPEIAPIPIWFVPGIKNLNFTKCDMKNLINMDIMRGEETEAAGLLSRIKIKGDTLVVLPGSHNKYVFIDANERLLGCMTTMGGEILQALTMSSILSASVGKSFADTFLEKPFCMGLKMYEQAGFLHSIFLDRILDIFGDYSFEEARNYLLGVILADELKMLRNTYLGKVTEAVSIVVAGKLVQQEAYSYLFKRLGYTVYLAKQNELHGLCGYGAISLAYRRGLVN